MTRLKGKKVRGKRILIVAVLFSLVFSALIGRMVYLMAVNGSKYKSLALEQQTKNIAVPPIRGAIQDRNGQDLAISMNIYRLDVDLNVLKKYLVDKKIPEEQADLQLSKILNIDKSKVKKILDDKDSKGNPLQFV